MQLDEYIKQPFPFNDEINRHFNKMDKLTVFEIGSCEGEDTIKLKKMFPNSTIFTFEPLPKNILKIKKHFKQYGIPDDNVYDLALSNKNGVAEFFVSSGRPHNAPRGNGWDYGNKSSSLLTPKEHLKTHSFIKFNKKIEVRTKRLESFCKQHRINGIDFVYLDVQGAELMVLQGAGDMLKKISMIWMEVENIELYANQPLKNDVEEFMRDHGFEKIIDTVGGISGDQLYLNRRLLGLRHRLKRIMRPREDDNR